MQQKSLDDQHLVKDDRSLFTSGKTDKSLKPLSQGVPHMNRLDDESVTETEFDPMDQHPLDEDLEKIKSTV